MNNIDFKSDAYKELCDRMSELMTQEAELKIEKERVRKELIALSGGDRMENGIKLTYVDPTFTYDYKKLVDDLDLPLDMTLRYRKERDGYWKITKY